MRVKQIRHWHFKISQKIGVRILCWARIYSTILNKYSRGKQVSKELTQPIRKFNIKLNFLKVLVVIKVLRIILSY